MHFFSILETNSLRLSNIKKSNDSTEIINIIPEIKEVLKELLEDYNLKIYIQYRLDNNSGIALVDHFLKIYQKIFM